MRFIIKLNIVVLLLNCTVCLAQYDNVWLFSDSIGIDFTTGTPSAYKADVSAYNNECNANICDSSGNLLFYIGSVGTWASHHVLKNTTGAIVQGGDTLHIDPSSTQGALFIPHPYDSSLYYLFYHYALQSQASSSFRVALINKDLNNGNGQLVYADSILASGFFTEKLTATKHSNGSDWWVVIHKGGTSLNQTGSDCFYSFLIDSTGIHLPIVQCDSLYYTYSLGIYGQMVFSSTGLRLACALPPSDSVVVYDFNRCNGIFSGRKILKTFTALPLYGCSFSPSGNLLYVSNIYLLQFNLLAANVQASKTTLWYLNDINHTITQHQLAPDNKIYIASRHGNIFNPPATIYNTYLSVVNQPDNVGTACNFSANSFYLAGRKCSAGLPNLVNYGLGAIEPPCVVSINEIVNTNNKEFVIYPNPATTTISFSGINNDEKFDITISAIDGRSVLNQQMLTINSAVDISTLANGVYYVTIKGGNQFLPPAKIIVAH